MFVRGMCFFRLPVFDWMGHDGPTNLFEKNDENATVVVLLWPHSLTSPAASLSCASFHGKKTGGSISAVKR